MPRSCRGCAVQFHLFRRCHACRCCALVRPARICLARLRGTRPRPRHAHSLFACRALAAAVCAPRRPLRCAHSHAHSFSEPRCAGPLRRVSAMPVRPCGRALARGRAPSATASACAARASGATRMPLRWGGLRYPRAGSHSPRWTCPSPWAWQIRSTGTQHQMLTSSRTASCRRPT